MESSAAPAEGLPTGAAAGEKGLKSNAIGYASNLVIGVASTAPGYSLAATLGFVVAVGGIGFHAPLIMLLSFIPMLLIASAYNYLNRADPDAGTSFAWVTRAMGPRLGWMTGWAIVAADIVVMAALAYIAGTYTFLLFDWQSAADSLLAVSIAAGIWIAVMTAICTIGIQLSARTQVFLLGAEILTLAAFAGVALFKVYFGDHPGDPLNSVYIHADWFNPFTVHGGTSALVGGILLGVFIYWGWDSGVCVNEESENSSTGPGKAAVMSTVLLVLIYVTVTVAAQSYAGVDFLRENKNDVLSALGEHVFGSPLDKLLIIAVLTSAAASTQTTILPTARTTLSMARWRAAPKALGEIHPRFLTPHVSTILMGVVSLIWTLIIINVSQNVLSDSITGLGFQIAFYYGITGFACAIYYRRELSRSFKNFFMAGVVPFLGGAMLTYIFIKALIDNAPVDSAYSGGFLGVGAAVAIGVGLLLFGVVLLVIANFVYPKFFKRKLETVPPGFLERPAGEPATTPVAPEREPPTGSG
ncbi:MAG: APC family permease [Actinomycetota bacterium]